MYYQHLLENLSPIYLAIILLAIICDITIGTRQWKKTRAFVKNAVKAQAEVVSAHFAGRRKYRYFEIDIKFRNQENKVVETKILGAYRKYRKGKKINILYLNHDEKIVEIDNYMSLYWLPIVFLLLTPLTFVTVAVIGVFVKF